MGKMNRVEAQALGQAPAFGTQMTALVKTANCEAVNRDDSGEFEATVVVRGGFTMSKTVSYGPQTDSGWESAMDTSAQQILAQLEQDMGGGIRESDPGNGPIMSGTVKIKGEK